MTKRRLVTAPRVLLPAPDFWLVTAPFAGCGRALLAVVPELREHVDTVLALGGLVFHQEAVSHGELDSILRGKFGTRWAATIVTVILCLGSVVPKSGALG